MEFDSQIDRITSNLEFEKFRDTQSEHQQIFFLNLIYFMNFFILIFLLQKTFLDGNVQFKTLKMPWMHHDKLKLNSAMKSIEN